MTQAVSPAFELCQRTIFRPRSESTRCDTITKTWIRVQRGEHVVGVVLPVRRGMEKPPRLEDASRFVEEPGLKNAAFVVSFLMPRVGKEKINPLQCVARDDLLEHLQGIVPDDADVM